jgi:hypothetical protein
MSQVPQGRRLRQPAAAEYLGISERSLEIDRYRHNLGIPYIKCGKIILYDTSLLDRWMAVRVHNPIAGAA